MARRRQEEKKPERLKWTVEGERHTDASYDDMKLRSTTAARRSENCKSVACRLERMNLQSSGWSFDIEEVSAGVYKASARIAAVARSEGLE